MKTYFLVASLFSVSTGCHSPDQSAVFRYPASSVAIRIERKGAHPFLAEYNRVLILERQGKEVARRAMLVDTGGHSRTNIYDLGDSKLLLISVFDAYVIDFGHDQVGELDRKATVVSGNYLGAFDSGAQQHWRFVPSNEQPEAPVEPRGG